MQATKLTNESNIQLWYLSEKSLFKKYINIQEFCKLQKYKQHTDSKLKVTLFKIINF